ncbi:hypothetical protein ID866_7033 [Astraeus odoratus]|nr:hypothetical protein ID866_7033 [Astraeus odoratus]
MDTALALETLSRQASLYTIVLNGRIDRDLSRRPLTSDFADIYEGTLLPDGTKVAVKTIHADPPSNQGAIEHFLKEIRTWSKLSHENVEELIGISTDFSLTNESVDPRPLLLGIANGLNYLHTRQPGRVFHGDIKGHNVLISDDGRALLSGFHLATFVNSSLSMPMSGNIGGMINWMAPEILDGGGASAEGDVWAFGMTTLELFTRERPFQDIQNLAVLQERILNGPPDRPSDEVTCKRMTNRWWDICTLCWQRNPSLRPPMGELIGEIEDARLESLRRHGKLWQLLQAEI